MTNDKVLQAFLDKKSAKSHNGNLYTNGITLVNYKTVIAEHLSSGTIWVNSDKYSQTTTTIQNKLAYHIAELGLNPIHQWYRVGIPQLDHTGSKVVELVNHRGRYYIGLDQFKVNHSLWLELQSLGVIDYDFSIFAQYPDIFADFPINFVAETVIEGAN